VRSLGHFQAFYVFYFLLPVFEYDTVKTEIKPHAKTVQKFVLELTQILHTENIVVRVTKRKKFDKTNKFLNNTEAKTISWAYQ
jgi:hypothetical protein